MKALEERSLEMTGRPNIVLVHGAWADGSCWSGVIEGLQAEGFRVWARGRRILSVPTLDHYRCFESLGRGRSVAVLVEGTDQGGNAALGRR